MNPPFRTLRFYGTAYSDSGSLDIQVRFGQDSVFHGVIPCVGTISDSTSTRDHHARRQKLFDLDIPFETQGYLHLGLKVQGGILIFGNIEANYTQGHYVESERYVDPRILFKPLCLASDSKSNVVIAGEKQPDYQGQSEWYYWINNCAFECDLFLDPEARIIHPRYMLSNTRIGHPDPLIIDFQKLNSK